MQGAARRSLGEKRLDRLLDLWRAGCGPDGAPPPRQGFVDPVRFGADLLPFMVLVDADPDGRRFRFRLCGTMLAVHAGIDLTGRYIDEVNPNRSYSEYVAGLYGISADRRRPVYSETRYVYKQRDGLTRRLICPLLNEAGIVRHFAGAQIFTLESGGEGPTYTFADNFSPGTMEVIEA